MTARITLDCLNRDCDCILLIKYDGAREQDIETFCEEIADAMVCPECRGMLFALGLVA